MDKVGQKEQLNIKDEIDLFYDHYKESCSLRKEAQTRRNKNFVVLCILEAISFLLLIRPEFAFEILQEGINANLEMTIDFGNSVLQTFLWILITYVLMRYCQDSLYVERQYIYEKKLEDEISKRLMNNPFDTSSIDREGKNYLRNYPIVLNIIDLFYKMFSPILFAGINIVRVIKEWGTGNISLALICDTSIFIVIIIIIWFYFFEIHNKITEWFKVHIPIIDKIAKEIRIILKEV